MKLGKFEVREQRDGTGYVGFIEPHDKKEKGWIIWLADDGTAQIWTQRSERGGHINDDPDITLNMKPCKTKKK